MDAVILLGLINSWTIGMIRFGYKKNKNKKEKNLVDNMLPFFFWKRGSICVIVET